MAFSEGDRIVHGWNTFTLYEVLNISFAEFIIGTVQNFKILNFTVKKRVCHRNAKFLNTNCSKPKMARAK